MGYGDDLLVTKLASKIKKQFPDRQIVIGEAKNQTAYHSLIYDHNPNISDCRNLKKTNQYILLITMKITDLILIMKKLIIQIMFGKNLNLILEKFILQKKKKPMQRK